MVRKPGRAAMGALAVLVVACGGSDEAGQPPAPPLDPGPAPAVQPGTSGLIRLTAAQYQRAVLDIFGEGVVVPSNLEPDTAVDGLRAIGARRASISPLGVERFESAAYDIASQAMARARAALVPCTPAAAVDAACARATLEPLGLKVWRRPLASEELERLIAIAVEAAASLGSFDDGIEFAIAALLQSPNFLFRVELGVPVGAGELGRYDDYEMASRLSFLLWGTTPDDELLAAAGRGELVSDDGLRAQAERLLRSPRAREAVRGLYADLYQLYRLDDLVKDPTIFTHMSAEVGPAAREETLRLIEYVLFDGSGDFLDLFTSNVSFVNRKLASIYDVRAPAREGFGMVEWPATSGRGGILTQISLLAANSHSVASSATLRGKFVRQVLLCGEIKPPPTDLNTSLPESSSDAPTLRDRVKVHLESDFCAGCHRPMDPIGLGFETFDALGMYRLRENGVLIDPSGELDGVPFADARDLGRVIREHPDVLGCMVKSAFRYATGRREVDGEAALIDWLTQRFEVAERRVPALLLDIVMSDGFRAAVPASELGGE